MANCLNCNQPLVDRYCSHCGQSSKKERITFKMMGQDILVFFTNMEKGFWYTSWNLVKAPGMVTINFIEGKRVRYQRPISYYLIWTAIYLLVLSLIEFSFGKEEVIYRHNYFGDTDTTQVATKYMSISVGVLIPFFALFLGWAGMRRYYNYPELLTAVLFGLGTVLLVQTVYSIVVLCFYLVFDTGIHSNVSDVMKGVYVGWFGYDLSRRYPVINKWLATFIFTSLSLGTYVLYRIYVFPLLFQSMGPG